MSNASDASERVIRRILVALDASPHSEAALEAAVQLAATFGAELHGVFVEDIDLLRTAALPVAREVHSFALPAQAMSERRVSRQLARQAAAAREALERAARSAEVAHTFSVVRGRVPAELLKAATDADLITLGKASAARCSRRKLGNTARAVLQQAPTSVLVLRKSPAAYARLVAYYDGSPSADRGLALAAALTGQQPERSLTVLLTADAADDVQYLRDAVVARCGKRAARLRMRTLTRIEAARLATAVQTEGRDLVILPAESLPLQNANVQTFLYELDRPLLIVR